LNAALYALGISEQDVFDTSNIGCYLPVILAVPRRRRDRLEENFSYYLFCQLFSSVFVCPAFLRHE
ncbi:hypothetical protein K6U37_11020, partial [Vibrio parahaemolyticus]|uniref:hypothetical protein n=1 Tax=Vibrio parahaemolyticus TaxID=670 RepID=UPI001EEC76D6